MTKEEAKALKPGEIVRCTENLINSNILIVDQCYEVEKVSTSGNFIKIKDNPYQYKSDSFEKYHGAVTGRYTSVAPNGYVTTEIGLPKCEPSKVDYMALVRQIALEWRG